MHEAYSIQSGIMGVAVSNGMVFATSLDSRLYTFYANGCGTSVCEPLWTSNPTGDYIESSPAVANGVVYVGSLDRSFYAYHLR